MSREEFIPQVRSSYLGLLAVTRQAAQSVLPKARLTDRRKMGGVVRTATQAVLNDMTPIAQEAAVEVYDNLREEAVGSILSAAAKRALPPPPPTITDVNAIVSDFISKTYGPGALADPAYKTEIEWVTDQISATVRDQWVDSLERAIGNVYNWSVGDLGQKDRLAVGYQRIARPNACTFCRVVALNQYTSFAEDGGYHKNCYCYAVPIFNGQTAFRPDYYEEFERQYFQYRDQPPGEDYQTRELRTTNRAEIRRRETFRNIRAGIKSETEQ